MTNLNDDDMTTDQPTESEEDKDTGGHGSEDTGDEPTESAEDRDAGGEGAQDTGDEA
jgi:hypothetical protein